MKVAFASLGVVLCAAALTSCKGSPDQTPATNRAGAAPSARTAPVAEGQDKAEPPHGLENVQLRDLMKRISTVSQKNWPKDIPQAREDQRAGDLATAIDAASKLAAGLAAAAERIPASVGHVAMSEADRAGFQAEAKTLRDQALQLGRDARAKEPAQIQKSLDAISFTCISCHSRYRDIAGELDIRLARKDHAGMTASLRPNSLRSFR